MVCSCRFGTTHNKVCPFIREVKAHHLETICFGCRFDLIYLMLDKPDEQNDRRLARHLVALHYENPEVLFITCLLFL